MDEVKLTNACTAEVETLVSDERGRIEIPAGEYEVLAPPLHLKDGLVIEGIGYSSRSDYKEAPHS